MKELSTETINIGGVDYKLFLNRTGIVAWEKFTKNEQKSFEKLQEKYKGLLETDDTDFDKLSDDANPFDGLEEIEDMDSDIEFMKRIYRRLYWIMLYTNHKLSITEASTLFDKAIEEYGAQQLIALGQQMIDEVNTEPESAKLKNLAALKPTRK